MAEQLQTIASESQAVTAWDLMAPNPTSIHGGATVPEVLAFLTDTGFSAAPVIDDAGRTIGVVSRTDVVVYERGRTSRPVGAIRAADLMTPQVFSVAPDTPATEVAREMVRQNVHRLFVVEDNVLVGVISALDLLRHFSSTRDSF